MACNFFTPRGQESSDTMSEVSEGTTTSGWTSNWDSREDLRDYIVKMGCRDVSDLYQERFRVDRKKLEQMLSGGQEASLPADIFFEQIMADTNTFITWPTKLKIGAKSKKDPHVRIVGKPEDVNAAKERVMAFLDTRSNRVTIKIDVSYVNHSHIIGKGGLSVKRIMEETQCHVHFPDSNRTNTLEKSNQVSIAGDIRGAELARSRVRQKTPVIFGFELPVMSPIADPNSKYFMTIQEQYDVQIMLKTRPKLHATLVLVKGAEWDVEQVKRATMLLVEHLCGNLASQISIEMSLEISPHHHSLVTGENHSNLKEIMRVTGAKILFPDAQDPNLPSLKKSSVTIIGNIHNVFTARQLLIGSLPLLMIFDLPTPTSSLKSEHIGSIQSKYDVSINIRPKASQNTMACTIKGAEKHASNIYKARNVILGIEGPSILADIPASYHLPSVPQTLPPLQVSVPPQPLTPLVSPLISPMWHHLNEPFPHTGAFMMQQPFVYNPLHSAASSGYQSMGPFSQNSQEPSPTRSPYSLMSGVASTSSPVASSRDVSTNSRKYQEQQEKTELASAFKEINSPGFHTSTVDKFQDVPALMINDYEQKRITGYKAMQARPTGMRYPNNAWSGYGISRTCPTMVAPDRTQMNNNNDPSVPDDDVQKTPTATQVFDFSSPVGALNTSNFMDHTPSNLLSRLTSTNWPDLTTLITSIGLEKYLGVLSSHEIDLTTFSSMTDDDLLEVGVTAFGARRKMLLAIAELKKRTKPFSLAPGAERQRCGSTAYSPHDNW